jgi:hypothetical protein
MIDKFGGYTSSKTPKLCLAFITTAMASAFYIPFSSNFYLTAALIFFVLFFGAALFPALTGISISSVNPDLKHFCQSSSLFFQNLLGTLVLIIIVFFSKYLIFNKIFNFSYIH